MKERPILFSTEMVSAILEGHKTMTRRVMKRWPNKESYVEVGKGHFVPLEKMPRYCPYGQLGDRLWVRETFSPFADRFTQKAIHAEKEKCLYRTDYLMGCPSGAIGGDNKWHPSIFMPRKYSRITLEITNVRAERLQDITLGDLSKEGMELRVWDFGKMYVEFSMLWDSINAKRGYLCGYSWKGNPWVWVVEFKRISN